MFHRQFEDGKQCSFLGNVDEDAVRSGPLTTASEQPTCLELVPFKNCWGVVNLSYAPYCVYAYDCPLFLGAAYLLKKKVTLNRKEEVYTDYILNIASDTL